MRGDHWTQSQLSTLKTMVERDVQWNVIVRSLKRTKGSCIMAAKRHGMLIRSGARAPVEASGWPCPIKDDAFVRRLIVEARAAGVLQVAA